MNSTPMVRGLSTRKSTASPLLTAALPETHIQATLNGDTPALADAGLIILDASLQLLAADDGALSILSGANQGSGKRSDPQINIPRDILEALRGRTASTHSATKISFRIDKQAYTCRAFWVQPQNASTCPPTVALYLQRESSLTDAIEAIAKQYNLSDREQQALSGIASGLSGKEMAEQMNISPNTVKSFLRILMIKMSVGSRAGIVSKLFEYSGHSHS